MVRTPNPEIPGASTALVAISNTIVQETPASLVQMQASLMKQVAFKKRTLGKETEVVAINSEFADFPPGMSMVERTLVRIIIGDQTEGEQPICGLLWV
jgi:hypothetical protein